MTADLTLDVHHLYELKVLEQVARSPRLNNRQAAQLLGVSVNLTHKVLSGMVTRGLLDVRKQHARRWDYYLTPAGIAEKARLTFEFLDFSLHFYRAARKYSAQLCKNLAQRGKTRIALLGANELAEIVFIGAGEWDLDVVGVYDDARSGDFLRRPVAPTTALAAAQCDAVIVCLYDAAEPLRQHYLPAGLARSATMVWVFDAIIQQQADGRRTGPTTPETVPSPSEEQG